MAIPIKRTSYQSRPRRKFSLSIKQGVVRDIERGKCTVLQASRELGVNRESVYKWIKRYSRHLISNRIMVVEEKSDAYRSQELEKRIKELEAALGRKQMELDILNKIIDLANEEYRTDLKKNLSKNPSNASEGKKDKNTGTK